ncbi:hypothetical protein V6N12_047450 [Hibiscus sabdariffa]|uniref:Uncharacterized protein n=1 Tax=Hibiscus sabdariffa TaxID=183260 RepID=A0ABR2DAY1_9ROSI
MENALRENPNVQLTASNEGHGGRSSDGLRFPAVPPGFVGSRDIDAIRDASMELTASNEGHGGRPSDGLCFSAVPPGFVGSRDIDAIRDASMEVGANSHEIGLNSTGATDTDGLQTGLG